MSHGLTLVVCSKITTSGTMNPFRHFGRTPLMRDQLIARPLYLHRKTRHRKTVDVHPWLERDSNPRPYAHETTEQQMGSAKW